MGGKNAAVVIKDSNMGEQKQDWRHYLSDESSFYGRFLSHES